MEPVNYKIGNFVVLQLSDNAKIALKTALEDDDILDFSELSDDEFKIVAEFDGVGVGELV